MIAIWHKTQAAGVLFFFCSYLMQKYISGCRWVEKRGVLVSYERVYWQHGVRHSCHHSSNITYNLSIRANEKTFDWLFVDTRKKEGGILQGPVQYGGSYKVQYPIKYQLNAVQYVHRYIWQTGTTRYEHCCVCTHIYRLWCACSDVLHSMVPAGAICWHACTMFRIYHRRQPQYLLQKKIKKIKRSHTLYNTMSQSGRRT